MCRSTIPPPARSISPRVPLEQIERVTIVRGAAAARYGPRALAGVVAIERRRATASEGWLSLAAGAWGERAVRGGGSLVHQRGERTIAGSLSGALGGFDGDFGYDVPAIRGGGTADRRNGDGRTAVSARHGAARRLAGAGRAPRRLPRRRSRTPRVSGAADRLRRGRTSRRIGGGARRCGDRPARWSGAPTWMPAKARCTTPTRRLPPPRRTGTRCASASCRRDSKHRAAFGAAQLALGAEARWLGIRASSLTAGAPETERLLAGWIRAGTDVSLGGTTATLSAGARLDRDATPE